MAGCSKVSPGCAHCYAEKISLRFGQSSKPWTPANAAENVVLHESRLEQPLRWRRPRMIFVNSMSDLFHELVPDEFILDVFAVMQAAPQHTFQVLTKRPERARELLASINASAPSEIHGQQYALSVDRDVWPLQNVWLGVSIENSRFTWRAEVLREIPAAVRFISAEPLLGSLFASASTLSRALPESRAGRKHPLDLAEIDWLIAGGESGHGYRPVDVRWVRELRDECQRCGVAFFFKQWGGRSPKAGGRELDGETHDELPVARAA